MESSHRLDEINVRPYNSRFNKRTRHEFLNSAQPEPNAPNSCRTKRDHAVTTDYD